MAMLAYLANGWFTQVGPRRLRAEVLDGAIDSAAWLHQAGAQSAHLRPFLLRLRTLTLLLARPAARPTPQALSGDLCHRQRDALRHHLLEASDHDAALQALALDCWEAVGSVADLRAMLLHLSHVGHLLGMLQLAHVADSVRPAPRAAAASSSPAWQAPR